MEFETLGDRCKFYEVREAGKALLLGAPVLARLDGRAFHSFTRGLQRPYDERLSKAMIETASHLVEKNNAAIGYTQSDEITLAWFPSADNPDSMNFSGRVQKLCSILAAQASVFFYATIQAAIPEKAGKLLEFDCRVWNVPDAREVYLNLLWREQDATKNSITMAASAHYSHKQLHGKSGGDKQEMLFQKGINWNDYPAFFKRGTYVKRQKILRTLSEAELARIPEKHRPTEPIVRSTASVMDWAPISTMAPEAVFDLAA